MATRFRSGRYEIAQQGQSGTPLWRQIELALVCPRLVQEPDGWLRIPDGAEVSFVDTSWDGRGMSLLLNAGNRFRILQTGNAHSLSLYELEETRPQDLPTP